MNSENAYHLIVSDQTAGCVKSTEAEALEAYAALVSLRGGHHLGNVLKNIAQSLTNGHWVKVIVDYDPNTSA